ncbi:hypothetical protein H9P43_008737 [Blastocladiella emersonii ATCC 22665]|nr:hypothetical protein H9P43_008737 [Blastocladiella emersonii ATCC 22665]
MPQLACLALKDTPGRTLAFAAICSWIEARIPFYRVLEDQRRWRRSMGYALSKHKSLVSIPHRSRDTRDVKWTVAEPDLARILAPVRELVAALGL